MSLMVKTAKEAVKSLVFRHTNLGRPRYPYNVEPIQLATLINELERTKEINGSIVEIGVARGMTTRFLCQHIVSQGLQNSLVLYAIDTFRSFTEKDMEFEVRSRGKSIAGLKAFTYNDFDVWRRNFLDYPFVKVVQSDCAAFDYSTIAPIKIAFLDVDLYLPTKKTLPKLFDAMVEGGVILVDDVLDDSIYDGAHQAYMEFCNSRKIEPRIIGNKCGVIHKTTIG
jgi:hypothetical protein